MLKIIKRVKNFIFNFYVVCCSNALSLRQQQQFICQLIMIYSPFFLFCSFITLRVFYIFFFWQELAGACLNSNCSINEKCRHKKYSEDTFLECILSGMCINSAVKIYMETNSPFYFKANHHLCTEIFRNKIKGGNAINHHI